MLATRRNKLEREGEPLDAGWKLEATDAGWGPEQAEELVAGMRPRDPAGIDEVWRLGAVGFDEDGRAVDYERVVTPEEWIAELLRRNLTVTSTTFSERDVTQAVAAPDIPPIACGNRGAQCHRRPSLRFGPGGGVSQVRRLATRPGRQVGGVASSVARS